MKGVILGGGLGTRLRPQTNTRNKHTLPVAGRPMIDYPILRLRQEGITDIAICLNGPFAHQVEEVVGDGRHLGCQVSYMYESEVGGPGRSLYAARHWLGNESFVLLFGDGIFFAPLGLTHASAPCMYLMDLPPGGADDPGKYAQAKVANGKVVELVEKPPTLVSTLVQAGAFVFPRNAVEVVARLMEITPPEREIGITEINQHYAALGVLSYVQIDTRSYIDCGTPEALLEAGERVEALRADGRSIF